ncbi:hypothetical protein BVG81_004225 [Haliangium sp. UPWRP_2]|nr:hypothetical protein BVG81_004225 [Haliangium sp. UPWRP_2]
MADVERNIRQLAKTTMVRQARMIVEHFSSAIAGLDLHDAPPLRTAEAPDGSFLIEWVFSDRRLGFNIEPEQDDSGWYFVSSKRAGGSCAAGSLSSMDIKLLIRWALNS